MAITEGLKAESGLVSMCRWLGDGRERQCPLVRCRAVVGVRFPTGGVLWVWSKCGRVGHLGWCMELRASAVPGGQSLVYDGYHPVIRCSPLVARRGFPRARE